MGFHSIGPDELGWEERERNEGVAPRWQAPLTEPLELTRSRARMWRYSPGSRGRRHKGAPPEQGGGEFLPDFD